jgi:AcrR family transcriptional regulator
MARPRAFDEAEALDRAMEVFWRHGYEGASFSELTKAMGMNSPSIYAAFGSKKGLFDAVVQRYRSRRSADREEVLSAPTAREAAERFLFGSIDFLATPDALRGCFTIQAGATAGLGNGEIPQILTDYRSAGREALARRLEQAQAAGELAPTADPQALARFLLTIYAGLAVQAADGASKAELRACAELALNAWPAARPVDG